MNEVQRGHDLVRRGDPALIQPENILDFLNKLQRVGYRINTFVLDTADELEKRGYEVGKFRPLSKAALWVMPTKPANIGEDDDVRKTYRREAAEAHNAKRAYMRSKHVRTSITLKQAEMFRDKTFYLPWSFDYRGRTYPIPSFLTPHDTDFGKSLIRFHRESFMTPEAEQWLAFQVATTYGLDKSTMEERSEWSRNNHELISQVATDPIGNLPLWEGVDEPWQFLAACEEYYHCVIDGRRQYTGLMVAVDATCSGMQILAGLSRCKTSAALVNVLPSETPQDAYKAVADLSMPNIPERLREYWNRSKTKRTVMTIPYNAKPFSNRFYIREEFKKQFKKIKDETGVEIERITTEELTQTVKAVRDALAELSPTSIKLMDWIGKEIGNAIKRGEQVLNWTTPSGFIVTQRRDKYDTKRYALKLLGRCMFSMSTESLGPDINKHRSSGAPNLIHSLDASLLHIATSKFNAPISVIHDSVLARATDMSELSGLVRETYTYLFAEHDYLTDFAQQIGAESEPPIIGDLEPSDVLESTYFFC